MGPGRGVVFRKTLRDSRIAMLGVLALIGFMFVAGGEAMVTTYGSDAARAGLAAMSRDMPASLRGLYGDPVAVDDLGGFLSWHYGAYFLLIGGLWSLLALSSTLASEAARGSLDLTLTTGRSRRAVALEKLAAHLAAVTLVAAAMAALAWLTPRVLSTERDWITVDGAIGFAIGFAVRSVVVGSLAFAIAPLLGRGAAAGVAGALMLGGYLAHGYRTVVPAFDTISHLTWWSWAAGHSPLAGQANWPGIALTAAVTIVLLALGVVGFERRDLGVTIPLPAPRVPSVIRGVHGPMARALGELLSPAGWWAFGLGLYGATMAVASGSILDMISEQPVFERAFRSIIPGIDLTTAAGFLQLAFVDFGFVLIGLAVAVFLSARWDDETSGRLESILAAPLGRVRWAMTTGIAGVLAVAAVTIVLALSIAVGVASVGQDPLGPALGTAVLAAYGSALVGVGMGAGGCLGASGVGRVVGVVAVGTFLLDTLAPVLRLPDWVAQLALTSHLGEPLVGRWDEAGLLTCAVIAVAGLVLGAWGFSRRDLAP